MSGTPPQGECRATPPSASDTDSAAVTSSLDSLGSTLFSNFSKNSPSVTHSTQGASLRHPMPPTPAPPTRDVGHGHRPPTPTQWPAHSATAGVPPTQSHRQHTHSTSQGAHSRHTMPNMQAKRRRDVGRGPWPPTPNTRPAQSAPARTSLGLAHRPHLTHTRTQGARRRHPMPTMPAPLTRDVGRGPRPPTSTPRPAHSAPAGPSPVSTQRAYGVEPGPWPPTPLSRSTTYAHPAPSQDPYMAPDPPLRDHHSTPAGDVAPVPCGRSPKASPARRRGHPPPPSHPTNTPVPPAGLPGSPIHRRRAPPRAPTPTAAPGSGPRTCHKRSRDSQPPGPSALMDAPGTLHPSQGKLRGHGEPVFFVEEIVIKSYNESQPSNHNPTSREAEKKNKHSD